MLNADWRSRMFLPVPRKSDPTRTSAHAAATQRSTSRRNGSRPPRASDGSACTLVSRLSFDSSRDDITASAPAAPAVITQATTVISGSGVPARRSLTAMLMFAIGTRISADRSVAPGIIAARVGAMPSTNAGRK